MKIDSSQVRMDSAHRATTSSETIETTRAASAQERAAFGKANAQAGNPNSAWMESARTMLSEMARNQSQRENNSGNGLLNNSANAASMAQGIQNGQEAASKDPKIVLLMALLKAMTGKDVKLEDISVPSIGGGASPAPSGGGGDGGLLVYERSTSYTETEVSSFAAQGMVKTSDGQSISFRLEMTMARAYHEESYTSITATQPRTKDPLVLNFNGTAAQLSDQRFEFDLSGDGSKDFINFVASGSGFLVFDRNGDGKVNDGSELFGAKTGDGFAELAAYDEDGNGWIDENDPIFAQLRLWTRDSNGNDVLLSLKDANVGALFLGRVATPFDIKDASNQLQGSVRSSGVFLQENGKVGSMQQIDLTV
ncbi:MAG: VCBS repeat-containing protein [Betaproteobacteria bacterium]|nr:VCBS repeat-containing protein [Betaproteobacteria bacterium]